ncbi:TPA: prophage tail fiber N-terminal domain-containing protein [Escherichia coli]|nr:phage tail protein [Escherichia coli]HCP8704223.1 prophage tail fiber N-terminal domain-containing protein [Escherichia coli]
MAVKISGVLKDGTGKPVQNCTIQLKAKRNSTTVVVNTLASENPDEAGRYSMDVEYGQYSVILLVEGFPPSHAGTITVYEDSQPGTLNDFLGAMTEDDARPEALRRFELMVEEVARNASVVAQNTAAAKKSASDASTSAREAATHATDAAGYARAAEQAKTDIDITLAGTLKTVNHLSEIAEAGTEAQQESRDNLGLKTAATMDVQTDIYNRTEGCVALPGAFGYGAYPTQRKEFDKYATSATFASWVQTTPPGRYLVLQYGGPYSKDIIEGVVFTGEVEIKMLETATHENQNRRDKFVIFNGVNQDVYCCEVRADSTNIRWTCLSQNLTAIDGARWLYNTAGPWYDVPFRDVAVGGLTQAAYRAANTDEYTIKRGDNVSGSTLIPCAVIVSNDGAPRYVLDTGRHFSGSYASLGNSTQATSDFIFGLFVRTA